MNIALCILTRNERECLHLILPQLPRPSKESGFDSIFAIDGHSTDGTVEALKEHGIPVITQQTGKRGGAFLTAFKEVKADAFIFFSPDGNEDIQDLREFRGYLQSGADIVIASRMMRGAVNEEDSKWLKPRKWANKAFNWMANVVFRKPDQPFITDSINGFRAITKNAAQTLELDAADYTIEYQMTIRALHAGLKIVEFPTKEGPRIAGTTGAPSIPTGIRFILRFWSEWTRCRGLYSGHYQNLQEKADL